MWISAPPCSSPPGTELSVLAVMSLWIREDRWEVAEVLRRERGSLRGHGEENWCEIGLDQGGLGGRRIRGSQESCRLRVRLCDLEKVFLRRVRGLEFAREARRKVEGSLRACSKNERDWRVRVTRSGERNASK